MRKHLAILMAVLLLLSMAATGRTAAAAAVEAGSAVPSPARQSTEPKEIRKVGPYSVVANTDSKANIYPFKVQTENSIWYLAKADIELMGEDAFYGGLEDILQYFEADAADAREALAGRIWADVPPIVILTDFCDKTGLTEGNTMAAYYDPRTNNIRLFLGWYQARWSLLHEYAHYLAIHCTEKPTIYGFYCESVAEYVAHVLCKNRMYSLRDVKQPDLGAAVWTGCVWSLALDNRPYRNKRLQMSSAYAQGRYDDAPYMCVAGYMTTRSADQRLPNDLDQLSYEEALSLTLYLVETYGEDRFLDNWDLPTDQVAGIYGLTTEELLTSWSEWNARQCPFGQP